jgi:hypothetical protein
MSDQFYVSTCKQLLDDGFVTIDENNDAWLTEKGKKRVAKILDKLTPGQEVMLQLAMSESRNTATSLF